MSGSFGIVGCISYGDPELLTAVGIWDCGRKREEIGEESGEREEQKHATSVCQSYSARINEEQHIHHDSIRATGKTLVEPSSNLGVVNSITPYSD